jgi:triacylglycerol esterase/lipase EstA (alpha/beta hydrolase family)
MVTALTLALAVLAGGAAYVSWAAREVARGANVLWFVAGAPVAALAIPALFTLVWMTLSWLFRATRPLEARLGFAGLVRLYRREMLAIASSIPRMIGYRWLMPDPAPAPAVAPVLLLHGVLCNAGVWQPMKQYLAARGIGPIYALSYGPPLASIDLFADQTAEKIDAIIEATGARQVVIVGHSMGGLVARAYLRRYGATKVRRLITVGTPHQGSVLAYMFPGVALSQLRPRNAWLSELGDSGADALPPIVSLWSWHDSMVAPQTSSVLERAENIALMGIGHNALLSDREVQERVAAEIERAAHDEPPVPGETETAIDRIAAE